RRALEALPQPGRRERQQLDGVDRGQLRLVRQPRRWVRLVVPGAHVLANVAAEEPFADLRPQVFRDARLQLDGQVADAPAGVEDTGPRERLRRAGLQALRTGPTVADVRRRVGFQFEGGQGRGEQKEG